MLNGSNTKFKLKLRLSSSSKSNVKINRASLESNTDEWSNSNYDTINFNESTTGMGFKRNTIKNLKDIKIRSNLNKTLNDDSKRQSFDEYGNRVRFIKINK